MYIPYLSGVRFASQSSEDSVSGWRQESGNDARVQESVAYIRTWREFWGVEGVTLAQLVKASVGQADVQGFEPHLGHNWLSCSVFLVKSRYFGLPLAHILRPNWQSLLASGSVAIQTWSIYKVYT